MTGLLRGVLQGGRWYGDVLAHDPIGRCRGRSTPLEKVEFATHLDLSACAQVKDTDLADAGAGQCSAWRLGGRAVLGVDAGGIAHVID
ncbi:hypothetical protein D3C85_1369020 [compost metagenome]